jgi:hypothetical protein
MKRSRRIDIGKSLAAIAATALMGAPPAWPQAAPPVASVYSSLAGRDCPSVEQGVETVYFTMECPGVGGYRLRVLRDEDRSSVTVVTPAGRQFPLEFWNVVTRGFSDLGPTAEWRVGRARGKPVPIALIVRVNAREPDPSDIDATARQRATLAVTKITPDVICVVETIGAAPRANAEARHAADTSAAHTCLQPLP